MGGIRDEDCRLEGFRGSGWARWYKATHVPSGTVVEFPNGTDSKQIAMAKLKTAVIANQQLVSRCEITGNPVGTDTWAVGHNCQCAACQKMLRDGARAL